MKSQSTRILSIVTDETGTYTITVEKVNYKRKPLLNGIIEESSQSTYTLKLNDQPLIDMYLSGGKNTIIGEKQIISLAINRGYRK